MKAIHSTRVMFGFTAEVTRALAHPARVELLDLLAQGERSVDSIAKAACLSVANASQHLKQLRRAGILSGRRDGNQTIYRLADQAVIALLRTVSHLRTATSLKPSPPWPGSNVRGTQLLPSRKPNCCGGFKRESGRQSMFGLRWNIVPRISPERSACRSTKSRSASANCLRMSIS